MQVSKKLLSFIVSCARLLASDKVTETRDACDRKEDLRALLFFISISTQENFYGKHNTETISHL